MADYASATSGRIGIDGVIGAASAGARGKLRSRDFSMNEIAVIVRFLLSLDKLPHQLAV